MHLGCIVTGEEFQLCTIVICPHHVSCIPMWVSLEGMTNDVLKVSDCTFLEVWDGLTDYRGDVSCLVHPWDEKMQELQGGIGLG